MRRPLARCASLADQEEAVPALPIERVVVDTTGVAWTCALKPGDVAARAAVRVECRSNLGAVQIETPTDWHSWSDEELISRIGEAVAARDE